MRGFTPIVYLLLLVTLFSSCKKEEDSQRPVITILEPFENTTVYLPDTIKVVAEARDETNITVVEVFLVNDLGTPIVTGGFYYPDTGYYKVTSYLPVIDKAISTGTYKIKVVASDYYNIANAYRDIMLKEIPRELAGYIAITASYPFESRIIRMNTQFVTDTSFVFPKGFLLSGLMSQWDQFYFVSPEPSVLYAFNDYDFELLFEFPAWLPRPEFSSILTDRELLYSTLSGDAGALNSTGQKVINTAPQTDKTIHCFAADDQYLYAEMVSLSGDIRGISAFYRGTGAIRAQRLMQDDIVALQPVQGKVLAITNSLNSTKICEFDPENMLFTELKSVSRKEVSSSLKMNEDDILIFTNDEVLLYEYDNNNLSGFLPLAYDFGRYDETNDMLYFVRDSLVDIVSSLSADPVTISFHEPVMDFHLVFNRK